MYCGCDAEGSICCIPVQTTITTMYIHLRIVNSAALYQSYEGYIDRCKSYPRHLFIFFLYLFAFLSPYVRRSGPTVKGGSSVPLYTPDWWYTLRALRGTSRPWGHPHLPRKLFIQARLWDAEYVLYIQVG